MTIVWMMEAAVYKITNMIAVRNGFMPAPRTMNVVSIMAKRVTRNRGTCLRIGCRNFYHMFVDMPFVRMVQMTIM